MEDEIKILQDTGASVLVLFGTLILGGVIILLGFIGSRYSMSCNRMDSTKDDTESKENKGEDSRDSVNESMIGMGGGKRVKNKKRREPQQEFTHSWMVGALKGHTSTVFDMNFSSNGKLLASCGEDGLRPEEEVLDPGEMNRYGSERVNVLNSNLNNLSNHREDATTKSSSSSSTGNSKALLGCTSSSSLATIPPALSPALSTKDDRTILSRRQRKNRTRTPRERREDDRDECCEQQSTHLQQQLQTNNRQDQQRENNRQQQSNSDDGKQHQQQQQPRQRRSHHSRASRGNANPSPSSSMRLSPMKNNITSRRKQNSSDSRQDDKNYPDVSSSKSADSSILSSRKSRNILPSKQREELHHLSDAALASLLRRYTLTGEQLAHLGYPVECSFFPGYAVIINHQQHPIGHRARVYQHLDVNAREFVPGGGSDGAGNAIVECEVDSGNGSGSSVESSDLEQESSSDSDKSSDILESSSTSSSSSSSSSSSFSASSPSCYEEQRMIQRKDSTSDSCSFSVVERKCARCYKNFYTNRKDGEYLHEERCIYHWGKLKSGLANGSHYDVWECCGAKESARGCMTAKMHVWTGLAPGYNGPFDGYVRTRPARIVPKDGNYGVYALDCEMCFTRRGLELAKVTVVGVDGKVVYDVFVKPDAEVIDYNTRFSGITGKDLAKATKSLKDVQKDLMSFVHAETILIGHGLENDLRALRILHTTVIDTCVAFPHFLGYPFRSSLKTLARTVLRREIQVTEHDSVEDARIAVDLMLRRLQHDLL